MGNGTEKNPYTREDVLKAIEENGGKAEGLDLSDKVFVKGIDLRKLNLVDIILKNAVLWDAHLEGARLWRAHLEEAQLIFAHLEESDLAGAHLQKANLSSAYLERAVLFDTHLEGAVLVVTKLEGAKLGGAHLKGVHLWAAKFSSNTDLEGVDWGDYILAEEIELRETKGEAREECLDNWEIDNVYRRLKLWYTNAGMSDTAAKFYYREKEANRKSLKWNSRHRWTLEILRLFFAYGEDWKRVLYWMAAFLILFAAAYYFGGKLEPLDSLYFSAVSFTALGYGNWVTKPIGWIKILGAFEAFIGVLMMALLLVTFVRKWTR